MDRRYGRSERKGNSDPRCGNQEYWQALEGEVRRIAAENGFPYLDNYLPDGRSAPGKPAIINYFYHEEVRGSENQGYRA